jgi:hypothetical protein
MSTNYIIAVPRAAGRPDPALCARPEGGFAGTTVFYKDLSSSPQPLSQATISNGREGWAQT